uniref:XK-related protein n=1 Tax=Geospiza parvula TaxID=87175 RepID=A0A8C3MIS7_GEOPR
MSPRTAPPRFGPLQLALAAAGTAAATLDLFMDGWVAAQYARSGHPGWAALSLALLAAASAAAQACSWLWLRSDPPPLRPAVPAVLLAALHVLQLGFFFRCLYALKVGWRVCWAKAEEEDDQRHMAFISHDISMLRLFETFLENTPQLTLLLYIILRTNKAEISQGLGMGTAFLCVSWSLLDYHQSLRSFLQDKYELSLGSSIIYFLWNLFLICPRILVLALFHAALALRRGCSLFSGVAGHVPLGQPAEHGLHGVTRPRAALPGRGGCDPLLQLVQCGTGEDAAPQHHLPRLHAGGQHPAGPGLALGPGSRGGGALIPHPCGLCSPALLPAGAGPEGHLLQVVPPQRAGAAGRQIRRGGCQWRR